MAEPDKKYYIDHINGGFLEVSESDASEIEKAGFQPAELSDVIRMKREEMLGGAVGQAGTALLSGLSGATLGLSDVALTKGGVIQPGELKEIREINPITSTVSEVGGGVLSTVLGGPMSLLTKAGAKVGARAGTVAAAKLGKTAENFVPKLAETAAREMAIGAGIGVGGALSQTAESGDDLLSARTGMRLLTGAGSGAAFGAGLAGVGAGAKAVTNTIGGLTKNLKAALKGREVLELEVAEAVAYGNKAWEQAAREQIDSLAGNISKSQSELAKRLFTGAVAAGVTGYIGGAVGGEAGAMIGAVIGGGKGYQGSSAIRQAVSGLLGKLPKGFTRRAGLRGIISPGATKANTEVLAREGGDYAFNVIDAADDLISTNKMFNRDIRIGGKVIGKANTLSKKIKNKKKSLNDLDMLEDVGEYHDAVKSLGKIFNSARNDVKKISERVNHARHALANATKGGGDSFASGLERFTKNKVDIIGEAATVEESLLMKARTAADYAGETRLKMDKVARQSGEAARKVEGEYRMIIDTAINTSKRLETQAEKVRKFINAVAEDPSMAPAGMNISPSRIPAIISEKIVPGARVVSAKLLTDQALLESVEQTKDLDRDQFAMQLMASGLENAPPELINSIADRVAVAAEYTRANLPDEDAGEIDKRRAAQKIRSVVSPETVIESFGDGTLTADQRDAFRDVYPEAYAQIRAIVASEVARTEADGGEYTRRQKNQIGLLLEDNKMYDPEMVHVMQDVHSANREEKAAKKRGNKLRLSRNMKTQSQNLME